MTGAGAGAGISTPLPGAPEPAAPGRTGEARQRQGVMRWAWWAALPLGLLYLILLAHQLDSAIRTTNLDADAVSGPVISQLFGAAPPSANVVLGTFGWYATLLFDLATKWLPYHRQVWEAAPFVMALAGAGLTVWAVWKVASGWAASLTAVLLLSTSPVTLRLELSTTQHAPAWFAMALLGAFVVWIERGRMRRWPVTAALVVVVGTIVGVNAASDPLVSIAGVAPFGLAVVATRVLAPARRGTSALWTGVATLVVAGVAWGITAFVMSALAVTRAPGLHTTRIAIGHKNIENFTLWWKSIATIGNGDYFSHPFSPATVLAFVCAMISIAAVASIPWLSWRQLRRRAPAATSADTGVTAATGTAGTTATTGATGATATTGATAFYVFWCSSAILLTLAFLFSAYPSDVESGRYLLGLLYGASAVVPAAAVGRARTSAVVLAGTCVFALSAVLSIADRGAVPALHANRPVTTNVAGEIARIAAREHISVGYAGYWDAAPATWATGFRVQVYPVAVCDQRKRLCRADLHFINSWYSPRTHAGSFLLTDPALDSVWTRPPDLGRPKAVYRLGRLTMYIYPYDLAAKIKTVA